MTKRINWHLIFLSFRRRRDGYHADPLRMEGVLRGWAERRLHVAAEVGQLWQGQHPLPQLSLRYLLRQGKLWTARAGNTFYYLSNAITFFVINSLKLPYCFILYFRHFVVFWKYRAVVKRHPLQRVSAKGLLIILHSSKPMANFRGLFKILLWNQFLIITFVVDLRPVQLCGISRCRILWVRSQDGANQPIKSEGESRDHLRRIRTK